MKNGIYLLSAGIGVASLCSILGQQSSTLDSVAKGAFSEVGSVSSGNRSKFADVPSTIDYNGFRKHVYRVSDYLQLSKSDFTQGIACILQAPVERLETDNGRRVFECNDVNQMQVGFNYEQHERLISRFITLKYTGDEDIFGESELVAIMPHCLSRTSALYREAVIKARFGHGWIVMPTEDVVIDEYKDVRFVQARFSGDLPSQLCVVSRFKIDTLRFSKSVSRNTSSVDQRFTIKSEAHCFSSKKTFPMHIQPIDTHTVTRIQHSDPNGRMLLCCSNIISIGWGDDKFIKSLTVNLPIPANPVKMRKLAKAEQAKAEGNTPNAEKRKRQEIRKEEKANKWYMGIYGDDENDKLLLFHYDIMSESWVHLPDVVLEEIRKDLLSFQMSRALHKFIVLRCRPEVTPAVAKKLVYTVDEQLDLRAVRFILYQKPREHSWVTVHCVQAQSFDSLYEELYQEGWRFHGSNGPPCTKDILLKEGSLFELSFRGNIKYDDKTNLIGKKAIKYYNSQMPCQMSFTITECDKHLQKNYDFFKGLCVIHLVDKSSCNIDSGGATAVGHTKSSSNSLQTKKVSSQVHAEKKRALCELMVQLAKGVEGGVIHTPPAGKLNLSLDPIYIEAINIISAKLGKEWEVLGKHLGLSAGRIEAIKTRNKQTPELVKEDMLYTWIKRQPRASDRLPKLYQSLMSCGRIDLAYKIEDLYSGAEDTAAPDILVTEVDAGDPEFTKQNPTPILATHNNRFKTPLVTSISNQDTISVQEGPSSQHDGINNNAIDEFHDHEGTSIEEIDLSNASDFDGMHFFHSHTFF